LFPSAALKFLSTPHACSLAFGLVELIAVSTVDTSVGYMNVSRLFSVMMAMFWRKPHAWYRAVPVSVRMQERMDGRRVGVWKSGRMLVRLEEMLRRIPQAAARREGEGGVRVIRWREVGTRGGWR